MYHEDHVASLHTKNDLRDLSFAEMKDLDFFEHGSFSVKIYNTAEDSHN